MSATKTGRCRVSLVIGASCLLLLAGCETSEIPETTELVKAPCNDEFGLERLKGPNGKEFTDQECDENFILTPIGSQKWIDPDSGEEMILQFKEEPPPPTSWGEWVGTPELPLYFDEIWAPVTDLWWLEQVDLEVLEADEGEYVVPITSFACTQLPTYEIGKIRCTYEWSVQSSRTQIHSTSWGYRVAGGVPVGKAIQLKGELSGSFKRRLLERQEAESGRRVPMTPKEGHTMEHWVGNYFYRDWKKVLVRGQPCHMTTAGAKECPHGLVTMAEAETDDTQYLKVEKMPPWQPEVIPQVCIPVGKWSDHMGDPNKDYNASLDEGEEDWTEWRFQKTTTDETLRAFQVGAEVGLGNVDGALGLVTEEGTFQADMQKAKSLGVESVVRQTVWVREHDETVPLFHVGRGYRFYKYPLDQEAGQGEEVSEEGRDGEQEGEAVQLTQVGLIVLPAQEKAEPNGGDKLCVPVQEPLLWR